MIILSLFLCSLSGCSAKTGQAGDEAVSEAAAPAHAEGKQESPAENQAADQSAQKTVVTMTIPFQDITSFEAAFEAAYPGYDLQTEALSTGVINGEISRRLRNHHAADLVVTNLPGGECLDYAYDLTTQAFMERYQDQIIKTTAYDGLSRYIPLPGSMYGYIINKTLLAELGMELPKTKGDILAILAAAKEKNIGVNQDGYCFGIGTIGATYSGSFFVSDFAPDFLAKLEGMKWLAEFEKGDAKFTGTWETSVDFLKACVDQGYLNPEKLLIYYNQSMSSTATAFKPEEELPNRTAIIAYDNLLYYNKINQKSQDEFALLPVLPKDEKGTPMISAVSSYFMFVNKDLEADETKLSAALAVMDFLSGEEGQKYWMKDTSCPYSYLNGISVDESLLPAEIIPYTEKGQIYTNPFQSELLSVIGTQLIPVAAKNADLAKALMTIDDYVINGSEEIEQDMTVVGTVAADMLYQNANTRKEETEIGNLVADAVRELTGADVALVNGGGVRSSLYKGDVTGSDLSAVCPYGNLIIVSEMDGATLREAITNGIQKTWKPAGQFLQVSGIKYSYKPAAGENETAELTSLTWADGSEIKDDEMIKVAYNNYMGGSGTYVDSGDGFTMLNVYDSATPVKVRLIKETGKTYKEALLMYFANHAQEAITSPLEGRIRIESE